MSKGKKKSKNYFTKETEDAIVKYNSTDDNFEKNYIFKNDIQYPFEKIAENILNTFKFQYFDSTPQDVINEVVSFMTMNIHKYKQGNGKAFSYFSVVAKNYLILHNNKNYKRYKRTDLLSEMSEFDELEDNFEERVENAEMKEFYQVMIDYWEREIPNTFKKKRDIDIAFAVLELFRRVENIESFKKKSLYIMIREMTGCKTQYITKVINKMRDKQAAMFEEYVQTGKAPEEEPFWP